MKGEAQRYTAQHRRNVRRHKLVARRGAMQQTDVPLSPKQPRRQCAAKKKPQPDAQRHTGAPLFRSQRERQQAHISQRRLEERRRLRPPEPETEIGIEIARGRDQLLRALDSARALGPLHGQDQRVNPQPVKTLHLTVHKGFSVLRVFVGQIGDFHAEF